MRKVRPHYGSPYGGIIENELGQALLNAGATVPPDGTAGFAPGCIFCKDAGAVGFQLYVNEGSATSSDFNPITVNLSTSSIGASTAGAGTTTADAGVLPAGTAKVYLTSAADDTVGVRINAADQVTGRTLFIANGVANKILKIYAPTGGTINGGSADAAFSTASGKGAILVCLDGTANSWAGF